MDETAAKNTTRAAGGVAVAGAALGGRKLGGKVGAKVGKATKYGNKSFNKAEEHLTRAANAKMAAKQASKRGIFGRSKETNWIKEPVNQNLDAARNSLGKAEKKILRPRKLGRATGFVAGGAVGALGVHKIHQLVHPNENSRASASGQYLAG
jgi:hypothetical protein